MEETDPPAGLDTRDRKVSEDSRAPEGPRPALFHRSTWRKENREPREAAACLVSPDPEVTKVSQVFRVVRVCLDFPVSLSRAKDSRDSLDSRGDPDPRASRDRRERLESTGSPAYRDHGVTTVHLVYLATLESLVAPVVKGNLENRTGILEVLELKVSQEIQATQAVAVTTAPPVTTAFQDPPVSLERREVLEKAGGLE